MRCSFCNKELKQGTGLMIIKNDGKIISYCSKKCFNNSKKRNPRNVNWINKEKKTKADAKKKVEAKKEEKKVEKTTNKEVKK